MGLREIRQAKGLTLKQLAELSGVHYMKIHQIETGKIKPENITLRNAIKLAEALGCTPEELLNKEETE
jgi:transcriptional regulator with XRE-family HTH domain